jgi:hypothetical protein
MERIACVSHSTGAQEAHKEGTKASGEAKDLVKGDGDKVSGELGEVQGLCWHKGGGVEQNLPLVCGAGHGLHEQATNEGVSAPHII